MKVILKRFLLPAAMMLCLLLAISACKKDDPLSVIEQNGNNCKVVYDFGEGSVNGQKKQTFYAKEESLLPVLGASGTQTEAPKRAGYHISGYYVKEIAADGTQTERLWNFETDRVNGDVTLYCRWARNYTVTAVYGAENEEEKVYSVAEETNTIKSFAAPRWAGHTFVGFYTDPAYTEEVTFPYVHKKDENNPDERIYARFLEGTYRIVRSGDDLKTISAGAKYYLMNDIDMTGIKVSLPEVFTGAIIGNSFTISNMTVERKQTRLGTSYGLFNEIGNGARIENVTFNDLLVTVELGEETNQQPVSLGLLAGGCADQAEFENVVLTGILKYDCKGRDMTGKIDSVGRAFGLASDDQLAAVEAESVNIEPIP